jgi:hypothetical protein
MTADFRVAAPMCAPHGPASAISRSCRATASSILSSSCLPRRCLPATCASGGNMPRMSACMVSRKSDFAKPVKAGLNFPAGPEWPHCRGPEEVVSPLRDASPPGRGFELAARQRLASMRQMRASLRGVGCVGSHERSGAQRCRASADVSTPGGFAMWLPVSQTEAGLRQDCGSHY